MLALTKPPRLRPGDKVATVSLSWGGAGDAEILWRYEQGKKRLAEQFGLVVTEMPHTLRGSEFIYRHPELRAADLMQAFTDGGVKAIFSCIGGNDSIRMLPYIDFGVLRANPKIYLGYSDSTVTHFMCMKAGLSSFYGPALLSDFAENVEMPAYTIDAVRRVLFSGEAPGQIVPSPTWTGQHQEWLAQNAGIARRFVPNRPHEVLQGRGKVQGRLIGGCLEVLEYLKGTSLFPSAEMFEQAILFVETSEEMAPPWLVEDELRCYGVMGILGRLAGMFWGKPLNETYYGEYKAVIRKVLAEFGLENLPVLYNGSFGHNEPKSLLAYGALAEIDCETAAFSVLEACVR